MSLDITVHHFNVDSSPPSPAHLLQTARKLVDDATLSSSRWRFIPMPSTAIHSSNGPSTGSYFVWGKPLPVIDRSIRTGGGEGLRDWDAPMEDDMVIIDRFSPLEFEGTDFKDIILNPKSLFIKRPPRSDSPPHGRRCFANDVDVNADTRPSKRLCSQYESFVSATAFISISRLIPFVCQVLVYLSDSIVSHWFVLNQPHYYESPDPARPPPPGIDKIPAYRVARSLSPSALLTEPFARAAWLVPLRGVPPIEGASAAYLVNMLTYSHLSPDESFPRAIQWTSAAVTQFWDFLLRQRNTNNFGPISLAYLVSPSSIQRAHREKREARRSNKRGGGDAMRTKKEQGILKTNKKRDVEMEGCNETTTAEVWEYIKIYHDSRYAMKLRSLLDSFRLEDDMDGITRRITGEASTLEHRVLKAIRLVLVDETGDAILLA